MIEIRAVGGAVLYVAEDAADVKTALQKAVRDGANLEGANLVRANLVRANLYRANLYRANLYEANLDGANLDGANLDGANLVRANLYRANLEGASLDGANLYRASLDGELWEQVALRLETALIAMNDGGRHWIKGVFVKELDDGSAAYCSIGSINANAEGTVRALSLWLLGLVAGGDIAKFNDHSATTWEDVIAAFKLAASHARRFAS